MRAIWNEVNRHVNALVTIGAVVLLLQASLSALEPVADVPEIDVASLTAGLGLLGAGMLWLRARRRVK